MIGPSVLKLDKPAVQMCERCGKEPAQMTVFGPGVKGDEGEEVCLRCFYAIKAAEHRLPGTTAPMTGHGPHRPKPPADAVVYKSLQAVGDRASKIYFYLHQRPEIMGNGEDGYWLGWDSPLVPGFKGPNSYKR